MSLFNLILQSALPWLLLLLLGLNNCNKNLYHKTKQIQFDHNTKHRTTHNSNQKINEKKNINHHKTTTQGSEPTNPIKKLKIKTTNLVITHTTKSTNWIKEQKGKTIAYFIHKPPSKHRGNKKKKLSSTLLIVRTVNSREFK